MKINLPKIILPTKLFGVLGKNKALTYLIPLLISIIVLALIIYYFKRSKKEPFANNSELIMDVEQKSVEQILNANSRDVNTAKSTTPGINLDLKQSGYTNFKFLESQKNYYGNKFNKEFIINGEISDEVGQKVNDLFNHVDTDMNNSSKSDYSQFFSKDIYNQIKAEDQKCARLRDPDSITNWTYGGIGCGWVYIDDKDRNSFSARGTVEGPIDPNVMEQNQDGVWMWDIKEAIRLENIKRCSKIKNCNQADMFPLKCGICTSNMKGIPVNEKGEALYPNDEVNSCEGKISITASDCNTVVDSVKAQTLPFVIGKDANGNIGYIPQRRLSGGVMSESTVEANICDPQNGHLTVECFLDIAKNTFNCTENGGIISAINNPDDFRNIKGDNGHKLKAAWDIIGKAKYINSRWAYYAMFTDNPPATRDEVVAYYRSISDLSSTTNDKNSMISKTAIDAAGWLIKGTYFDDCFTELDSAAPLDIVCLQRAAREAGCQPDGKLFPSEKNMSIYANKTYKNVMEGFKRIYRAMFDSTEFVAVNQPYTKRQATLDCLGISRTVPGKICNDMNPNMQPIPDGICNPVDLDARESGVEILWYGWEQDYDFPKNKKTVQPFLGRQIASIIPRLSVSNVCPFSVNNLKDVNFNGPTGKWGEKYNPIPLKQNVVFRLRSNMRLKQNVRDPFLATFLLGTNSGISVDVGGKKVTDNFSLQDRSGSISSAPFWITGKNSYPLDMFWYAISSPNFQAWVQGLRESMYVPDELGASAFNLTVPKNFPLCRWDFYNMDDTERNNVLSSVSHNIDFTTFGKKKCAVFRSWKSVIRIANPMRLGAFKSYTYMINTNNKTRCRLFSLTNYGSSLAGNQYLNEKRNQCDVLEGGLTADGRLWAGFKFRAIGTMNSNYAIYKESAQVVIPNTWVHVAYVFDPDLDGIKLYCNGGLVASATSKKDMPRNVGDILTSYMRSGIGCGPYEFDMNNKDGYAETNPHPFVGYMAWAHWFDYTMSKELVQLDMKKGFSECNTLSDNGGTGWITNSLNGLVVGNDIAGLEDDDQDEEVVVDEDIGYTKFILSKDKPYDYPPENWNGDINYKVNGYDNLIHKGVPCVIANPTSCKRLYVMSNINDTPKGKKMTIKYKVMPGGSPTMDIIMSNNGGQKMATLNHNDVITFMPKINTTSTWYTDVRHFEIKVTNEPAGGVGKCKATPYTSLSYSAVPSGSLPVRLNDNGDVECMSANAHDCLGIYDANILKHPPPVNKPLVCGEAHRKEWGYTGYEAEWHWCKKAKDKLCVIEPKKPPKVVVRQGLNP